GRLRVSLRGRLRVGLGLGLGLGLLAGVARGGEQQGDDGNGDEVAHGGSCPRYIRVPRPAARRSNMPSAIASPFHAEQHAYAVVRELGQGGQGRTLLVEREGEPGSRYVLKLLWLEHVDDWKQ